MGSYARSSLTEFSWGRIIAFIAIFAIFALLMVEPAFAQSGAFSTFENSITTKTTEATGVATTILGVAAILALIIGIAPMLWGQIKVKWIISCLCAAALFGLAGPVINAFAS
ncbi:MAG: hypothetical protein CL949_20610 [Erythrobacter sp.]|nr:hypothetical protein [Erythrobacter sp.]